jgi:hypothetical protein
MQRIFLFLIIFQLCLFCIGQEQNPDALPEKQPVTRTEKSDFYKLGNKRIALKTIQYGMNNDIVMINLHDDEITGLQAAKSVLEITGGIIMTLENNGERLVKFTTNGRTFTFDPNRIFSKTGVRTTLRKHNKHYREKAAKEVNDLAKFLLARMPSSKMLIALHNNDHKGLSILSYIKNGELQNDALLVNRNETHDIDNFFLTTDKKIFRMLRADGYNVVLQHNKQAKDDGSLSVYYGRRNKKYINIEAESGKISEQKQMIESVIRIIEHSYKRIKKRDCANCHSTQSPALWVLKLSS